MNQASDAFYLFRVTRPDHLVLAKDLRHEVFVIEQSIPEEIDNDGWDVRSMHVLVFAGNAPAATGRWREEPENWADLSRIAVLPQYRGKGLGRMVVEGLLAWAEEAAMPRAWLTAHHHLIGFYESLGFENAGEADEVAGHPLIRMEKALAHIC